MIDRNDPHAGLHNEQCARPGERPCRARNPIVKLHDLACPEFEYPDLVARRFCSPAPSVSPPRGTASRRAAPDNPGPSRVQDAASSAVAR